MESGLLSKWDSAKLISGGIINLSAYMAGWAAGKTADAIYSRIALAHNRKEFWTDHG